MAARLLEVVVLLCGAGTMTMELVGSRVFAPYLGTSIYIWTSLIGIVLAALSAGYYWGGQLADRAPETKLFSRIIFAAGLYIALVAYLADPLLVVVLNAFDDVRLAAVAATVVLFGPPSVLLGAVLPFAARLSIHEIDRSGTTVGRLYALSTIGSISGTFLTGFVLIASFSNTVILLMLAALLCSTALLAHAQGRLARALVVGALLFGCARSEAYELVLKGDLIDVNTRYNRVWIFDTADKMGRRVRRMQVNDENSSAMLVGSNELVADYTRYYRLAAHFKPDLKSVLMIGGAAYSYPKDFLARNPEATMDVVEIDPGLTQLAREHFGLKDDPRLKIYHEDARTLLNRSTERYDAVLGDAFRSFAIPHQLTTLEAMRRIHAVLTDDGVAIFNFISAVEGDKGRLLRAELETLRQVFPRVLVYAVQHPDDGKRVQNLVIVALKSDRKPKYFSTDSELNGYLQHVWVGTIPGDVPVLTDDYAPVERYGLSILPELSARGWHPVHRRIMEAFMDPLKAVREARKVRD
ncbi:MAG: Polyamine aminopropyltransferase [Candidatus Omnitrophica bacterium]|nr:Polyamine aminopropyltransferase [Candidatus Omnitrophota bacterium]